MRRSRLISLPAAMMAFICLTGSAAAQEIMPEPSLILDPPRTFTASYQARARGMRTGAYRRLIKTGDNQYELSHGLSVSVLGANVVTVRETSRFAWSVTGAVPLHYEFAQSGVRRRAETVDFDWENKLIHQRYDDREQSVLLENGALDNLSFSAQMSSMLTAELQNGQTEQLREGRMFSFSMVDGRDVENHEYRILGEEVLNTPIGKLQTLKAERVREDGSRRSTLLWLAAEYNYVLARLEQVESNGAKTELMLQSITMD
jgi:hypothetical protein